MPQPLEVALLFSNLRIMVFKNSSHQKLQNNLDNKIKLL